MTEYSHPFRPNPEVHKKGWGREYWFWNNEDFCVKELVFDKEGNKCSLHSHREKKEIFICTRGSFKIIYIDYKTGEKGEDILGLDEMLYINRMVPHQMVALQDDSCLLEISTQHFESDSYRISRGDSQNQ